MAERKRNTGSGRSGSSRNTNTKTGKKPVQDREKRSGMGSEAAGIILIGISLLMIAGIFTDRIGRLGRILREMDFTTFGIIGYIFPFLILYLGIAFITGKADFFYDRRFLGFTILITSMAVFFSVKNAVSTRGIGFTDALRIVASSYPIDHGGIFGYIFAVPMVRLTGEIGTFIFTTLGYIAGTVLLLNMTMKQALEKLKALITGIGLFLGEKISKVREERREKKILYSDENETIKSRLKPGRNGLRENGNSLSEDMDESVIINGKPMEGKKSSIRISSVFSSSERENDPIEETGRNLTSEESKFREEILERYRNSGKKDLKTSEKKGSWFKNLTARTGKNGSEEPEGIDGFKDLSDIRLKKDVRDNKELNESGRLNETGNDVRDEKHNAITEETGFPGKDAASFENTRNARADLSEIARKLRESENAEEEKNESENLKLELPSFLNTGSSKISSRAESVLSKNTVKNYDFDLSETEEDDKSNINTRKDTGTSGDSDNGVESPKDIPMLRVSDLKKSEDESADINEDELRPLGFLPSDDPIANEERLSSHSEEKRPDETLKTSDENKYTDDEKRLIRAPKKISSRDDLKPLSGRQLTMEEKEVKPPRYNYPEVDLLRKNIKGKINEEEEKEIIEKAEKLRETLLSFGVEAKVLNVSRGPSVTRYELQPKAGIKVSKITNLSDDIALSLAASGVRIEAPIPGKAAVGIEIPNKDTRPVFLREVIDSEKFKNANQKLAIALGEDISGEPVVGDMARFPHVLIAGATGSGKSVCINSLIVSLLYKYTPEEVRLIMVDPKVVELSVYNGIPHLLIPVVTDPKKATGALHWAVTEMTRRYQLFAENSVKNLEGYNALYEKGKIEEKIPYIVIIVDELADLMMVSANEVEDYILRLSQMARAAGMHLVIATQRPSVDVITGVIKANIPSRISFAVSSYVDSKTILDQSGAEKLLGKGDMLYYPVGAQKPRRVQGAFISEEEVESIVEYIRENEEEAEYDESVLEHIEQGTKISQDTGDDEDELLGEAINTVVYANQASTSFLQRKMKIGYSRAARIMDALEARGVISGPEGSKPRKVNWKPEDIRNE